MKHHSFKTTPLMSVYQDQPGGGGNQAVAEAPASAGGQAVHPHEASANARPEYIPEKYWREGKADVEMLGKSYQELERKFHARNPWAADLPVDAAGYALDPEAVPEGIAWTPEMARDFAETFHTQGITNAAGKALVSAYLQREEAMMNAAAEAYEARLEESRRTLEREWGGPARYQEKVARVAEFVTSLGYGTDNARLFADPEIVGFLGKVTSMLGEDAKAAIRGAVAPGGDFTPGREEARRIMRDRGHPDHEAYLRGDHHVVERVKRLIDGE